MRRQYYINIFILIDFLGAVTGWIVFYFYRKELLDEDPGGLSLFPVISSFLVGGLWLFIYALFGFYSDIFRKSRVKEFLLVLVVSLVGSVLIFFAALLDDEGVIEYKSYYYTFLAYFLIHLTQAEFLKMFSITFLKKQIKKGKIWFNTVIVGSNKNALEIYEDMQKVNYALGLRFIGYVHVFDKTKSLLEDKVRHFGDYNNLAKLVRRGRVEHVIIAVEPSEHKRIENILNILEDCSAKVSIIPDIYQILIGSVRVNNVFGVPLIEINQSLIPFWQRFLKRAIDMVFSLSVLVLCSPFLLFVGIMVRLSSKGPIIYSQERIGKNEKPFLIYKFRSMYINSENDKPQLAEDNDPRITPWGRVMRKMRIDEIPQFYNVLIGDMSLVGPRPERRYFIDQIIEKAPHYKHLLRVRPGITSLGQVKYGYAQNVNEMIRRLKYDIIYIENMSLAMDFRILLITIIIIFEGRGK